MPTQVLPRPVIIPRPPPVTPPVTPGPEPPVVPAPVLGVPTGTIPTDLQIAWGRGKPWSNVTRHNPYHIKYGVKYGVRPSMLEAMEVIESGGESIPNANGFPNFGVMQLTHSENGGPKTDWELIGERLGVDFKSPEGQIAIAAYRLGGHYGDAGTPEEIFLAHYYPIKGGLDVKGPDGATQRQYLADMKRLEAIVTAAPPATKSVPTKRPPTERELLAIISNNAAGAYISFGFNQLNTQATSPIYKYGAGHGLPAGGRYHPGADLWMPDETPVSCVFGGEVTCVGARGTVTWDQGCGYFSDDDGGIGNITILTDAFATIGGVRYRLKMTYGHMSSSVVRVGQKVADGERIGRSGVGITWPHVHLDVVIEAPALNDPSIWMNPGAYHLVDPIPTIIAAWGDRQITVEPTPEIGPFIWKPSPNYMSRQGKLPLAIIYHVSDDLNLGNVLSWLTQRGSDASSHWVIDRDGTAYQLVGSMYAAFTNGPVLNPRQDIPWLAARTAAFQAGRENPNWYSITLEHIGKPGQPFPAAQIATSTRISTHYLAKYPTIPRNRGGMGRHSDIASIKNPPFAPDPTGKIDRSYCPSDSFPLREMILAVGGDPDRMAA